MSAGSGDTDGLGAAVAAADAAMKAAIVAGGRRTLVTASLDLLGPIAEGASLEAEASVTRQTRTLAFATARVSSGGQTVASVDAVYRLTGSESC